jgi:hypothetical protein
MSIEGGTAIFLAYLLVSIANKKRFQDNNPTDGPNKRLRGGLAIGAEFEMAARISYWQKVLICTGTRGSDG